MTATRNRPSRTWHDRVSGWLLCAVCAAIAPASLAADPYPEAALKAAYLYRIPGYIEWPEASGDAPLFTIAVLGDVGVVSELERMLVAQPIKDRPARVRKINAASDIGAAQVLFIGAGLSSGALRKAVASLDGRPILIITDEPHGLETGSAINFTLVNRRVRFEVSLTAAKRAGLTISSELLSVAARVVGPKSEESAVDK